MIEKVDMPTNDLTLADELRRTLTLLRDILETHSTSMIPFESKRIDFQQIVYSIVDPLLQMCSLSAAKLGVIEMAVYLVNCLSAIRATLAVFAFSDEKIEMLEGQVITLKSRFMHLAKLNFIDRCKYRYINWRTSNIYTFTNRSIRCLSYC